MSSPKKNVAYVFYISLIDTADTGAFKANPTIAAGDFKVSGDGASFANLATLPVVDPAGSIGVKVSLSQSEMNFDKIMVQCIDAAGAEWDDVLIFIDATVANVDDVVRSTTPANTLDVTATGAAGIDWGNVENPTTTVDLSATDIQLCDTVTTLTGHTVQTGDSFARLGAPAGASVSADIADVPTVSEFNARTLVSASYFDPAADTVANVTTVGSVTTKTGYALSSTGADLILKSSTFALAMADANWDELLAGHVAADSAGLVLNEWQDDGRLDLLLDAIPTTAMRGTDGANTTTPPTVGAIADQVWDEAQADHVAAGSFGITASEIAAIPTTAMRGTDNVVLAGPTKSEMDTAHALLATPAQVNTQVDNALDTAIPASPTANSINERIKTMDAGILNGTVDTVTNSHTPTTTEFQADDITEATADHFIGRIVTFLTGVLADQSTDITDYAAVGGIAQFTVSALTDAPANDDTFKIT